MNAITVAVPSLSRAGQAWRVTDDNGRLSCACPPFNMGPTKGRPCKHVRLYHSARRIISRCAAQHGAVAGIERLCVTCLVALLATSARKVRRDYVTKEAMRQRLRARPQKGGRRKQR